MKYMKYLSVLLVFYSSLSMAGLLIEPVVGYNFINKVDVDGPKDYKSGAGLGYGGRVGYKPGAFEFGLDYLHSDLDMGSGDFDSNISMNEYGAFVGFEFPILVRVYGTYIFSADANTEVANQDVTFNSGTGWKLGVGFTLLPFIDINADYRQIKFDDEDVDAYMLSLSLPFNLF